jgi:hypothetical protein
MFEEVIFLRFGVPRMVISDGGTHFIYKQIKNILQKTVDEMETKWKDKLPDAL